MDENTIREKCLGATIQYVKYNPMTEYGFSHLQLVLDNGTCIAIAVDPNSEKSNLSII